MKIIFNDATEISVQAVKAFGDYLNILTVGNTPEQLRVLFEDAGRTAKMTVQERGQIVGVYEGYTAFYRTEIYTGKTGLQIRKPIFLGSGWSFFRSESRGDPFFPHFDKSPIDFFSGMEYNMVER